MAITICNIPSEVVLSSLIEPLKINCALHSSVRVRIAVFGASVLDETYYAVSGTVTVYALADLCEAALKRHHMPYGEFSVEVRAASETASATLKVLHFDRFTTFSGYQRFLSDNFLTTLPLRRIPRGFNASLALFARADEAVRYSIRIPLRDPDSGKVLMATSSHEIATPTVQGVYYISVPWQTLANAVAVQYPGRELVISQFTVVCGMRSATFFVDDSLRESDDFIFRNVFKVMEHTALPCSTTAKTTVERSLAVVAGIARHYDHRASKVYDLECGPLTAQEAEWLDQLVTSHEVYRLGQTDTDDPRVWASFPVLITEATCEMADGDDPNYLKLSWRYADNRPELRLSASPDYFTEQFNPTFS